MNAHTAGLAQHKCQPAFDILRCRNQRRVHVQACRISTLSGDRCPLSQPVWRSPPTSGQISSSRSRGIMRPVQCKADRALQPARVAKLRELLSGPNILKGACCHDGLSARLIEDAGFPFAFMSGFCVAASRLGAPDAGLLSYGEVLDQGRSVNEATRQLPIIGDGDTGYGNAVNVQRTVRGFAAAGFAGILIEDQVAAKSCGHVRGKEVVPRAEAVSRIRAAVEARDSAADIVIIARSDARQAVSLDEALWRAQAFAEAGADVVFIDALESVDELRAFCQLGGAAASVPKMANNLEGGKSPQLRPEVLQDLGFKLVAYPLSLLGVSVRAMQIALQGLAQGQPPPPSAMPSFQELQAVVGFPDYFETAEKYAIPARAGTTAAPPPPPPVSPLPSGAEFSSAADSDASPSSFTQPSQSAERAAVSGDSAIPRGGGASADEASSRPVVEADTIIAGDGTQRRGGGDAESNDVFNRDATVPEFALSEQWRSADRRSLCLRIKVSGATDGAVKLETRVPAGFLNGLAAFIPQVAGLNLDERLTQAQGESSFESGDPLVDFISGLDRIEVFIESATGAW